jgi:translation initiation factor IF-2
MASRAKEASGSLEDISKMIQQGDLKELNVIIKGDVQGSVEALKEAFEQIGNEEAQANVIHAGVGAITENDVNLAASSEEATVLVGFNVRPDSRAAELAEEFGIKILTHSVIYDAIDQVRNILEGLLEPDLEERVLGRAEVREVFSTPNAGNVAGCYVEEGVVKRNAQARLLRDNQIVTDTEIASLKRFQEDVKEVQTNYECGIGLAGYNDIKIGDVIEVYHYVEVRATLD